MTDTACDTTVDVTLKFGSSSVAWAISPEDFIIAQLSRDTCVGGFFAIDTSGTSAPPWIVGDVFLKNVYSVFRANPPSVGFATLSNTATAMNGRLGAAPSATVGVAATVSGGGTAGTGTVRSSDSNGAARFEFGVMGLWFTMLLSGVVGGILLL